MKGSQPATVLIDRCSCLVMYYDRHAPTSPDKSEMYAELTWLASDAERWGVSASEVGSGVLEELCKSYDRRMACRLYWEFSAGFRKGSPSCPASRREPNATGPPLGDESVTFARGWRERTTSAAHPH